MHAKKVTQTKRQPTSGASLRVSEPLTQSCTTVTSLPGSVLSEGRICGHANNAETATCSSLISRQRRITSQITGVRCQRERVTETGRLLPGELSVCFQPAVLHL